MNNNQQLKKIESKNKAVLITLLVFVLGLAIVALMAGSSGMSVSECLNAILRRGTNAQNRIIWNIRIPRVLAALIAGAGLAVSGLIMQTVLNNPMASPSTLGVSNAAVFGANLSIIAFAGGYLSTQNNVNNYLSVINPYSTSLLAFIFASASTLLILVLCRSRSFMPNVVVLAGVAIGSMWSAATTILQFYATDVGLSAAVIWTFGDLGRATYKTNAIMLAVVLVGYVFFRFNGWKLNGLLSGETVASTMGINVKTLRFISLMMAAVITAVCVSFLGIIGFVGIICPHITKKVLGHNHNITIPVTALNGCVLLLIADTLARSIGNGSSLPVGAITSLLGAPFFMTLIFSKKEKQ